MSGENPKECRRHSVHLRIPKDIRCFYATGRIGTPVAGPSVSLLRVVCPDQHRRSSVVLN